jgi:type IV pilus assembly protein PilW
MNTSNTKNPQKGLTLIELMIALVLGLLLVAGTIQVFVGNKQTARVTEAHSRIQENARFALEILTRDIRAAGYSGCRTVDKINIQTVANAPVPASMSGATTITGSNDQAGTLVPTPSFSASLGAVVTGTDLITVQRGTGCGANLVGNIGSSNANIQVYAPNTCSISANDVLMIADCEDAHIFRATNVSSSSGQETVAHASNLNQANHFCTSYSSLPQTGACDTGETKLYGYDSELFRYSSLTYYIRSNTSGNPSLYVYDETQSVSGQNPLELVEGIENLQIEYGADDNDDDTVDRYANAKTINDATDWDKVVSARISILAQTLETNLTTGAQKVTFNGTELTGTDGRIRRVFTSTIAIRNRVQ